ncbi:MAG: hypothetical protein AAGG81_02880 [Chlamydiota bacterium]
MLADLFRFFIKVGYFVQDHLINTTSLSLLPQLLIWYIVTPELRSLHTGLFSFVWLPPQSGVAFLLNKSRITAVVG